jgi:hypothetical protein
MSNGTTSEHRVTIFAHAGVTKVWPPYLIVKAGDSIVFKTIGTSATVLFPHSAAFDPVASESEKLETSGVGTALLRVETDDTTKLVTQSDLEKMDLAGLRSRSRGSAVTDTNCQIYAYSVYCDNVNDVAMGQSSPVMIIEPPDDRPPP